MENMETDSMAQTNYMCRKLCEADLETVMTWRMLPYVTKYMNTDVTLTIDGQIKWFKNISSGGVFYYWIIESDGNPCGLINLSDVDMANKRCAWGYYVAEKKYRSFNLALSLEMSLYDYVFDIVKLNKISAEILAENTAAIKMHELCGCETEGILKQHVYKHDRFYDVVVQSMLAERWRSIRTGLKYQKIEFLS